MTHDPKRPKKSRFFGMFRSKDPDVDQEIAEFSAYDVQQEARQTIRELRAAMALLNKQVESLGEGRADK